MVYRTGKTKQLKRKRIEWITQHLQLNNVEVISGLIHNPFKPGQGKNYQFATQNYWVSQPYE